jgi:plasmid stability protein
MKNVTITLDERTAAWIRRHAAAHDRSVSRMIGDLLRAHMREEDDYDASMRRYLARPAVKLKATKRRYPTRDSLHDRSGIR